MKRIAVAQIAMRWSTQENTEAIVQAIELAYSAGAAFCAFSELAVTGFHKEIAREAVPASVLSSIQRIQSCCAQWSLAAAVGAPTFGAGSSKYNSHLLINEFGEIGGVVSKQGLTAAEATFFERGSSRPVARLQDTNCSAVICREIADLDSVIAELPPHAAELIFVPGALRQDPERPRTDPPEYVNDISRLVAATRAFVVHTNWPNALNRPEESVDGGGSTVASPTGEILLRLPQQSAGIGVFNLGERSFAWHPEP